MISLRSLLDFASWLLLGALILALAGRSEPSLWSPVSVAGDFGSGSVAPSAYGTDSGNAAAAKTDPKESATEIGTISPVVVIPPGHAMILPIASGPQVYSSRTAPWPWIEEAGSANSPWDSWHDVAGPGKQAKDMFVFPNAMPLRL
ncbi:MAG: hypothetical protein ACI80V_002058 [Rhodothermales bacterium]|jgi:hypothetical protein